MAEQRDYAREHAADHVFHTWINRRQQERRQAGEPWESDLYEWMHAEQEMRRLPVWLERARTGTLPTSHQQCSHSPVEPIEGNRLICALGQDVTACPILASLYASFERDLARERQLHAERGFPLRINEADADVLAARVCCWHIFMEKQRHPGIDTSEGYVQDESDRRFWGNVYSNLAMADQLETEGGEQ